MRVRLYKLEELCEGDMVIPTTQDSKETLLDEQYMVSNGKLRHINQLGHSLSQEEEELIRGKRFIKIGVNLGNENFLSVLRSENSNYIALLSTIYPDKEIASLERLNYSKDFENIKLVRNLIETRYARALDIQFKEFHKG